MHRLFPAAVLVAQVDGIHKEIVDEHAKLRGVADAGLSVAVPEVKRQIVAAREVEVGREP